MKRTLLEKAATFEAPSPGVPALLRLLQRDDPTIHDVEAVIRPDPVLTLELLRLANSALFEGQHPLDSIERAIVRIGQRRVIRWMLARATRQLAEPMQGYGAEAGIRSIAVLRALIAERLAEHRSEPNPGLCYCAALLADIGKLVLDPVLDLERLEDGERFVDREKNTFGIDHAALGARLARHWGLPEHLVGLIRWHHHPDHPLAPEEARLICMADALASALHPTGVDGMANPPPPSIDALGIDETTLDRILLEATMDHHEMLEMLR